MSKCFNMIIQTLLCILTQIIVSLKHNGLYIFLMYKIGIYISRRLNTVRSHDDWNPKKHAGTLRNTEELWGALNHSKEHQIMLLSCTWPKGPWKNGCFLKMPLGYLKIYQKIVLNGLLISTSLFYSNSNSIHFDCYKNGIYISLNTIFFSLVIL